MTAIEVRILGADKRPIAEFYGNLLTPPTATHAKVKIDSHVYTFEESSPENLDNKPQLNIQTQLSVALSVTTETLLRMCADRVKPYNPLRRHAA